jgi:hypothetical protein
MRTVVAAIPCRLSMSHFSGPRIQKKNNYLTCISKTLEHYARSHHPQEHDDDDLIACPSDHWPVSYIAINDHDQAYMLEP